MEGSFGCSLRVERVPTDENIADLPSREEYRCLEALNALYLAPGLLCDALAALMEGKGHCCACAAGDRQDRKHGESA